MKLDVTNMRVSYGILCLCCVIIQVLTFEASPLPGIIYDNPFCKKLIPVIEIGKDVIKPIKRCHRMKRNTVESSHLSNIFPNQESLYAFDTDGSNKIPYNTERELKLVKGNTSFDNNPYKKKVVTKQNIDKINYPTSNEDIFNKDLKNLKSNENIPISIQELLKSYDNDNNNNNYRNENQYCDDKISNYEDYSRQKNNCEKNGYYDIKKINIPENNFQVIEIEINNSNKTEVLSNQKATKRYTKMNESSKKRTVSNDPLSIIHNIDNENSKINKNCKRNVPKQEDIRIKVIKPSIIPGKKLARDPGIKVVIKCKDKNYKFKCKRQNSENELYDNCFDEENFDQLRGLVKRDFESLDYENDHKNYDDNNDDLKLLLIEERLKNYGNFDNVLNHLSQIINDDLNDSRVRKIELRFGKDINNKYNEIKSVNILTDEDLKTDKDGRFLRELDKGNSKMEDDILKLPSESQKDLDTDNINNIYDIPELKNNIEATEKIIKFLDLLGITEIIGNNDKVNEVNSGEIIDELSLNSDNINEDLANSNIFNLLSDDKADFITNKRQTNLNEIVADADGKKLDKFNNLPPEIIKLLAENYVNDTEPIDNEKMEDFTGNNEEAYKEINTIQVLPESNPSNYLVPVQKHMLNTDNDDSKTRLSYGIFSKSDDGNRKIISDQISRFDRNGETTVDSTEIFKELPPMRENRLPGNPDNVKINSDDLEMIRKYIFDSLRPVNETAIKSDIPFEITENVDVSTKGNTPSKIEYNEVYIPNNIIGSNEFANRFVPSFSITGFENENNQGNADFDVTTIIRDLIKMDELNYRNKRFEDDAKNNLLNFDDIMKLKNVPSPLNIKPGQLEKSQPIHTKYDKCIIENKLIYPVISHCDPSNRFHGGLFTNLQSGDDILNADRKLKRSPFY